MSLNATEVRELESETQNLWYLQLMLEIYIDDNYANYELLTLD